MIGPPRRLRRLCRLALAWGGMGLLCVACVLAEEAPVTPEASPPVKETPATDKPPDDAPVPVMQASTKGGPAKVQDSVAEAAAKLAPPPEPLPPGLEAEEWVADAQGNPVDLEKVAYRIEGEKKPRAWQAWTFHGGEKPISAWRCEGLWRLDLTAGAKAKLRIYNATAGTLKVSVAFSMGRDFEWHESPPRALKPGWNAMEIAQDASDFKCAASEWKHAAPLPAGLPCRGLTVVLHSGRRKGRVFLAGARLQTRGGAPRNDDP